MTAAALAPASYSQFAAQTLATAASAALGGWMLDKAALGSSGLLWAMIATTALGGGLWLAWIARRRPAVS